MIEAVIFDMDGVVIDSEPFWIKAEIEVYNKYNIRMTEEMCLQMKGVKTEDVVKHWYSIYKWTSPSQKEITSEIFEKVTKIIQEQGKAMPGLLGLLEYLQGKHIKIGLATSSFYDIVDAVMQKLQISTYFDVLHSAESEKKGKPSPDVYLGAAKKLGVNPQNCIAIEDSYFGLVSANAAGMFTIAMPGKAEFNDVKYDIANLKVKSLKDIIELDYQGKLNIIYKDKVEG